MKNTIRSARGEIVNFDLLTIKEQIASTEPSITIRAREDFIDSRSRRKAKKLTDEVIQSAIDASKVKREIEVDASIVVTEDAGVLIDEVKTTEPTIKQKAKG